MHQRRKTRQVNVGGLVIGGGAPVSVQSMTKTPTTDVEVTLQQIRELADLGCKLVRCAVPNVKAARALGEIKRGSPVPVVADIHFGYELAMEAVRQGVDGIRVNPGNMPKGARLDRLAGAAGERGMKIRVGANSGSVKARAKGSDRAEEDVAELMVGKVLEFCDRLERCGFRNTVISLKASDVMTTMRACRRAAARCDLPMHLGVTAAGPPCESIVKSAIGIGGLLSEGIGDTIRVSFTGPPHGEVEAGYDILAALGLARRRRAEIISCPTCGRCQIDLPKLVEEVSSRMPSGKEDLKIAVMGCVVNGPGEAREADIGVAGGRKFGYIFAKGRKLRKVPEERLAEELLSEIERL